MKITPAMIEAEELRQIAAIYLSDARFYEHEAERLEAAGEPLKAAVARKHASEERAGYERCQARIRKLTGEVA